MVRRPPVTGRAEAIAAIAATSTEPARPGVASYRAALSLDAFRWLWLAVLFTRAGSAIAQVAMPLLVYDMTGSSGLLGAIFVIQLAPSVVLAPVAGLLADRLDRRRLMIACALIRAGAVALIPFAGEVWMIGGLAAVVAIAIALSMPAELSILPLTVPSDLLVPALSLTQVTNSLLRIIGLAVGASLIGAAGPGPAFWTEAVCFLLAVACLARLVVPRERTPSAPRGPLLASAREDIAVGLRVAWRTPIIRGVTVVEGLWSLVGAAIVVAGLVLIEQEMDLGNRSELAYGVLSACMAGGALLGALLAGRAERRIGRPFLMAVGYLGPLFVIPAIAVPPLPALFVCWFLFGFADAWAVIAFQAYLAESVADELRGRVYATWAGVTTLAFVISYGSVGWVTDHLGAPLTIALAGLIVGIGGPLALVLTGALAQVRRDGPVAAGGAGPEQPA